MTKATWNGTVLAESNDTILLEGNRYFPLSAPENTLPFRVTAGEKRYLCG